MRQLTLRVESPQITINGCVYPLLLDDVAIFSQAQTLLASCVAIEGAQMTAEQILTLSREVVGLIEQVLGAGAVGKISGGKPVSLPLAIEWLGAIAREAAEHCADAALAED